MRSLSPVEAAVGVAIAGSVLAAAVPSFVNNLQASRLAEPVDGLEHIAVRATSLAALRPTESAYPESVGLTPAQVPAGDAVEDPPGTWDHATWRLLEFGFETPHWFSFSFESWNAEGRASFVAVAHGDLDGDGLLSTFQVAGESREQGDPVVHPMSIHREVE